MALLLQTLGRLAGCHHRPAQLLNLRHSGANLQFRGSRVLAFPAEQGLTAHARRYGWRPQCSASDASPAATFKLVLYSKQDCPLCDKLKEKLGACIDRAAFMPASVLAGIDLEVRDIGDNPAWTAAYSMAVPVLAVANLDGSGEVRCSGITCLHKTQLQSMFMANPTHWREMNHALVSLPCSGNSPERRPA